MSGGASTRVTAEKCLWREEGGGAEAAARCLAFLEEVGIEVDWIGPDDEAQLLDVHFCTGRPAVLASESC